MKTKQAQIILSALGTISGFERLQGAKKVVASIATSDKDMVVEKSYNNIPYVKVAELRNMSVSDALNHRYVLIINPAESLSTLSAKLEPGRSGK
jgi:hypothetical protein